MLRSDTRGPAVTAILLLLTIASWPLPASADVAFPVGERIFELDYAYRYRLATTRQALDLIPATGPFAASGFFGDDQDDEYSPALRLFSGVDDDRTRIFVIGTERFLTEKNGSHRDLFSGQLGLRYRFSRWFDASIVFRMDRERAISPTYTGKKWRGLAGEVETAAIYFNHSNLRLTLGRQRLFWGPQPVNLLLSETAFPLDLFSVDYHRGCVGFHFLFARLDQSRPDSTDLDRYAGYNFAADNRYLVGHRLDIKLHRTLRLSLFETSVYGGNGRVPEMYYLNPLQFFHGAQLNEGDNDNTILGFDLTWLPRPGLRLYGQMIVDDYQIENESQGDQEPDELGFLCGLALAQPTHSWWPDFGLEYTRITNRTYHQTHARNRYLYRNEPLGHPLGPDADSLSVSLQWWPRRHQSVRLELAWGRNGVGSLHAPWTEPWDDSKGDYQEPFPTGVVERKLAAQLTWQGYPSWPGYVANHCHVSLSCGYADIDNHGNVDTEMTSEAWLHLSLSWLGMTEVWTGN